MPKKGRPPPDKLAANKNCRFLIYFTGAAVRNDGRN